MAAHAIESELRVIEHLMVEPADVGKVLAVVRPDECFDPNHRVLLASIESVWNTTGRLDSTMAAREIHRRHGPEVAGKAIEIMVAASEMDHQGNGLEHAKIVHDCWRARRLTERLRDALVEAEGGRPDEALAKLQSGDDGRSTSELRTIRDLLESSYTRAHSSKSTGAISLGDPQLDLLTGGLRPGKVGVIAADTSWGKSSWCISVVDDLLLAGRGALIISTEDTEDVYGDRFMARRAAINARRLRDRQLTREEHAAVARVLSEAQPMPMFLDGIGVPFERLIAQTRNVLEQHNKIEIVVLDYIQECRMLAKAEDDRRMFREIARQFRATVKRAKRAGLIASQITLSDKGRAPTKNDIRECRDIGHGAELVLIGWTPDKDITDGDDVRFREGAKVLRVDKAKEGIKGTVDLRWDAESACFRSPENFSAEFDDLLDDGRYQ